MYPSPTPPVSLHVVVADDSDVVRGHLVEMLTGIGGVKVVAEAADTPGAIVRTNAYRPEVVILDIQMPGGSGVEALKAIKEHLPQTTVIMLTSHSDPFYRKKCLERGASFFFDKTTEFERVSDVIRGMLGNGPAPRTEIARA